MAEDTKKVEENEMVEISKNQLDSIMERLKAVEDKDDNIIVDDEITEHFLKVKLVDGQPLYDVRHPVQVSINKLGEPQMICDITVIDKNGKKKIIEEFDYGSIRDLTFVTCKIIKNLNEIDRKKHGVVPERVFDHASGLTKETGMKVSLRENVVKPEFLVDFNGKEVAIKEGN